MKVSVIIPCYNSAKTIVETIESVLKQKNIQIDEIQIILVNDGSTDNILDVLKPYEDKVEIHTIKNSGVSYARNYGLKFANGKYIQYLDSDDILDETKLSKQIKLLEDTNSDVAYGAYYKFYVNNNQNKVISSIFPDFTGRAELKILVDQWCPPAALLFRRNIVNKIGSWNEKLPIIQDARYLFDAANLGAKFVSTNDIVAYYRVNNSHSLSSKNKIAFIRDVFVNIKEILILWKNDIEIDLEKKSAVLKVLRYCVNEFSRYDIMTHSECVNLILKISPNYIPEERGAHRIISKLLGFKIAEKIAIVKRRLN